MRDCTTREIDSHEGRTTAAGGQRYISDSPGSSLSAAARRRKTDECVLVSWGKLMAPAPRRERFTSLVTGWSHPREWPDGGSIAVSLALGFSVSVSCRAWIYAEARSTLFGGGLEKRRRDESMYRISERRDFQRMGLMPFWNEVGGRF